MEMSNEEIIRRYKQAKHKASQIQILAELNACPKSKILEIVSDSIVPKHPVPAQHKEQPEPVKAVDNLASFEEYVVNRMDEIDGQLKALEEVQKYRKIGTVEECREAVEKQKKGLSVDEAKRIAAKAICIGCGYLTGYECSYNGRNCMISKPMLESVSKSFDDWNRRANDGKID